MAKKLWRVYTDRVDSYVGSVDVEADTCWVDAGVLFFCDNVRGDPIKDTGAYSYDIVRAFNEEAWLDMIRIGEIDATTKED